MKDNTVKLMEAKYNLNEKWLRTGEGEMFTENVESEELNEDMKELVQLLKDYGNPKIIAEFKSILLKIKKITDEVD